MEGQAKNLKIKTGILRRLTKEKIMYEQEATSLQEKLKTYKDEGRDEYFIKKQHEVLKEANMMVPDTLRRLHKAFDDLKMTVEGATDVPKESEIYEGALIVLKDAEPHLV
ncbi:tubulin-specific chaperone A [Planococcus citri]|uniref:tubulin-specific chaperone A n=1 Tax=Planococcus citri TaxID=170843 RepID=UPI0031F7DA3F